MEKTPITPEALKQISKIKIRTKCRSGLFENKSMSNIVHALNEIIDKTNEQTEVINHLIERIKRLGGGYEIKEEA